MTSRLETWSHLESTSWAGLRRRSFHRCSICIQMTSMCSQTVGGSAWTPQEKAAGNPWLPVCYITFVLPSSLASTILCECVISINDTTLQLLQKSTERKVSLLYATHKVFVQHNINNYPSTFFFHFPGRYLLKNNLKKKVQVKWDYIWIGANKNWFSNTGLRKRTGTENNSYIITFYINTLY